MIETIKSNIQEHIEVIERLYDLAPEIEKLAGKFVETLKKGNKILLLGNGGSAADCQHIASELVGKFKYQRKGLPAIALTTDTSILTSLGNDYGFSEIFVKQIEALAHKADLIVGISTSGNSQNVINGIRKAKELGCFTAGLLGKGGGKLKSEVDLPLVVPSSNTPRIQEAHILIAHIICEIVDKEFSNEP